MYVVFSPCLPVINNINWLWAEGEAPQHQAGASPSTLETTCIVAGLVFPLFRPRFPPGDGSPAAAEGSGSGNITLTDFNDLRI